MKVGKRQQQGRYKTTKTVYPSCGVEYLAVWYVRKKGQFKRVGLCCPSDECEYSKKDVVDLEK